MRLSSHDERAGCDMIRRQSAHASRPAHRTVLDAVTRFGDGGFRDDVTVLAVTA
jgi:hypothetical protein